jgi:hypothetical protein
MSVQGRPMSNWVKSFIKVTYWPMLVLAMFPLPVFLIALVAFLASHAGSGIQGPAWLFFAMMAAFPLGYTFVVLAWVGLNARVRGEHD